MKFKATFSTLITVTLWFIFALSIIAIAIGIMVLCNIQIANMSYGQARVLLFTSPLIFLMSLILSTIYYKVDEKYVHLNLAFVDVLSNKIKIENILNIVIKDQKLYISYLHKGMDPIISQIMIAPRRFESFKTLIMSKNKNTIFINEDDNENTYSQQ